ncbi:MAG: hypothetical protein CSYNP_02349 [Syntrophus sp. SKADARSKE-3]|nr:hypothetical protein [Syntrophus sp. SKADARSKE-3]
MTETMKPVFWYQGAFLQPQLFQQHDLHTHSLLSPVQTLIQSFFWGACRLGIRKSALKNQVLEISGGDFLFRDGTWVSYPGNAMLQARSFKGSWVESDKPLKVYVGLRRWDPSGNNVTVLNQPDDILTARSRYVSPVDPERTKDLYQSGIDAEVKYLYHALKIFWEGEVPEAGDYDLIPVAQLEFDGHDTILSQRFAPPTPTLTGSEILHGVIMDIREQVTARCRILEEYKNPRGMQIQPDDTNALTYLLALRSLNRYVPLLHHVTDAPHIHPWNVYALIRELVGELSTFTDRVDSLGQLKDGTSLLPAYDHENICACYQEAQTLIEELLNQIMIGAENVIYFIREGDYFKAQIPQDTFDNRNMFYLILKTTGDEQTIHHMAKISSVEKMPTLVKRALPGMPLDQVTVLPPGLPRRSDSLYFKLDRSSQEWSEIQKSANICVYWHDAPEETAAEIIIIRR